MIHDKNGLPENYVSLDVYSVYRQNGCALPDPASIVDQYCGLRAERNDGNVHAAIALDQNIVAYADIPGDGAAYIA